MTDRNGAIFAGLLTDEIRPLCDIQDFQCMAATTQKAVI
jgi:hypothetical protein